MPIRTLGWQWWVWTITRATGSTAVVAPSTGPPLWETGTMVTRSLSSPSSRRPPSSSLPAPYASSPPSTSTPRPTAMVTPGNYRICPTSPCSDGTTRDSAPGDSVAMATMPPPTGVPALWSSAPQWCVPPLLWYPLTTSPSCCSTTACHQTTRPPSTRTSLRWPLWGAGSP